MKTLDSWVHVVSLMVNDFILVVIVTQHMNVAFYWKNQHIQSIMEIILFVRKHPVVHMKDFMVLVVGITILALIK